MTDEKPAEIEQHSTQVKTIPPSPYTEARKASIDAAKLHDETEKMLPTNKKKKSSSGALINFLYDPKKKAVLGRNALNWGKLKFMSIKKFYLFNILAKLSAFYTVFYFCLGCFFVVLLYAFYLILDRHEPRYYDTESTMAVRTSFTVGLYKKIKFIICILISYFVFFNL